MSLPLKTIWFNKKFILGVFILLHVFLFNINKAEWGDSYRMLRASEFIKKGAYPADEKRPPLFPSLLALRPNRVDPIVWGRGVLLVTSLLYFSVFIFFAERYIKDKRFLLTAYLMFIFNPVFLYWSIRIMSDLPFAFLCLLGIYWLSYWEKSLDLGKSLLLGFLAGLAVLMRFEGYLLSLSLLGGITLNGLTISRADFKLKRVLNKVKANFKHALVYLITFALTTAPYILLRNPFNSTYFEETSGRSYDLKMLLVYFTALLFSFGFIPAIYFIFKKPGITIDFFTKNISLTLFVIMELLLILLWPAAIPRLFVNIIPLLIIPLVLSIKNFFSQKRAAIGPFALINAVILMIFIGSQYFLKQQFLVPQKWWFVTLVCLQIPLLITIYYRSFKYFCAVLLANLIIWSMSPIILHKDTFISVTEAAVYVAKNISGVVAHNDVSSVSDWYINHTAVGGNLRGYYYNSESRKNLTFEALSSANMDYLLITNEHNTTMTLDLGKRPYLEEIMDFRYNISGKTFFAKVIKVNKDYKE